MLRDNDYLFIDNDSLFTVIDSLFRAKGSLFGANGGLFGANGYLLGTYGFLLGADGDLFLVFTVFELDCSDLLVLGACCTKDGLDIGFCFEGYVDETCLWVV